jgi:hypothetical protein
MTNWTFINRESNKKCKQICIDKEIFQCENCGYDNLLSFAHKHKRIWYKSQPEKLHDFSEFLLLCLKCHHEIEYSREKTEELFKRLRGVDNRCQTV